MSQIGDIRFAKNEWPTIEAIRFWMRAPAGGAVRGRSGKGKFGSEMRNSLQKRLLWRDRGLIIPYQAVMSRGGRPEPELVVPLKVRLTFNGTRLTAKRILTWKFFFSATRYPPREMECSID